ncbi:MAG: hypothetical protein ACYC6Y_10420 [Thermoguttaceae bacterium]
MNNRSQTPPARIKWGIEELAARWGIPESRVLHWILTGQLRAVDASDRPGGTPDYRVDIVDLVLFEKEREIRPCDDSMVEAPQ